MAHSTLATVAGQRTVEGTVVPGGGPVSLSAARCQFPALTHRTYLDSACIGLAPYSAVSDIARFLEQAAVCPVSSGTAHHVALRGMRESVRPVLAQLLGCESDDVALVESTTHGLAVAARALPLQPGDRVLFSDLEYIQTGAVWSQMEGIGIDIVPHRAGVVTVDDFRRLINPRTRVIAVSSVQWTNGYRIDLPAFSQLCRDRGIWLVVDAAQHLGVLPVDVRSTPVDILVAGGHKWLNSPFGTGVMYISPHIRERLVLPIAGFFAARPPAATWGESFQDPATSPLTPLRFTRVAAAWEHGGTANVAGAVGLAAAARLVLQVGPQAVAGHVDTLTRMLTDGLDRAGVTVVSARDDPARSAIVTFSLGDARTNVASMEYLLDAGISVGVRYTSGVGGIRTACHYFNTEQDIGHLLDAVASLRRAGLDFEMGRPRARACTDEDASSAVRDAR